MTMKGQEEGEGLIVPLEGLPESLFQRLLPHKIYDGLPWNTEKEIMLNGWQHFAENREQDTVYVFNCCLLQNPMCETMMRFDFSCEESGVYIREIMRRIEKMQPVVIYLSESRIADRIRYATKERGKEWLRFVISYHSEGGYGRKHGLQGFDGYIACLEERHDSYNIGKDVCFLSEGKCRLCHNSWGYPGGCGLRFRQLPGRKRRKDTALLSGAGRRKRQMEG